jgi:hypothetical protein
MRESGLKNLQWGSYKLEMELEMLLKGSFPNPGDEDKIRNLYFNEGETETSNPNVMACLAVAKVFQIDPNRPRSLTNFPGSNTAWKPYRQGTAGSISMIPNRPISHPLSGPSNGWRKKPF